MKPRGGNFSNLLHSSFCEGLKEAGWWSLVFLEEWKGEKISMSISPSENTVIHFFPDYLGLTLIENGV